MNLADINDVWNRRIIALPEPAGRDVWQTPYETIALGTGDCEDYAIGKYFSAILLGFGKEASVATVKLTSGQAHCVMMHSGWVLDNLAASIVKIAFKPQIAEFLFTSTIDEPNDPRFKAMLARMDEAKTFADVRTFLSRGR